MGGMWSVTLTDAVQISLVLLGLIVLGCITVLELGGGEWQAGINQIFQENSLQIPVLGAASAGGINVISDLEGWENPDRFTGIPTETLAVFSLWFGWVCIGMLGNIPGQDLMQRVFSAKSANTARLACILAGILYLAFGLIPVGLALAVFHLQPWVQQEVITHLARSLLHPIPFTIFFLALISAILSTIDSAILSPASVLSQNIFSRIGGDRLPSLVLNRLSVVLVTAASVGMTFSGESAYELLEGAYELTMVGLFVPLAFGIYLQPRGEWPAFGAMFSGTALWLVHYLMGWELLFGFIPLHMAIAATLLAAGVYFLLWRMSPIKTEISDN